MNRPMSSGGSTDGIVMGGDLLKLSSSVSCSELAEVSPYGECFGSLKATFLRKPGWHRLDSFTTVMGDMVTCVNSCRHNQLPSSNLSFPCDGFNFRPGKTARCELFKISNETNSSNIVQTEELVFYFQKTCMRVSHRCGESAAFVFDVRHRYTLRTSAETRREDTEQKCAQVCLDRKCKAFVWDPTERNCLLSHDTQKENLERKPSAIYYENNCLPPSTRCPTGKRVEFLLVRQADVPSFGVSVGVRQVRNCISECINTPLFFCRSIQFNPITSECFVSNESSEMAVSSTTLDLYEPYCSEANDAIPNCNKPFSFEKIITSRLSGTFVIEELNDETVESCLSSCAGMRKKCRGVNYDVKAKRCALMAGSRSDHGTSMAYDETFDYFEPSCLPEIRYEVTTTEISMSETFKLRQPNRTLRQDFRNVQHMQTKDLGTCWNLCRKAAGFICRTFSYSQTKQECMVSSKGIESESNYEKYTQESAMFHLYVRHGLRDSEEMTNSRVSVTAPTTTTPAPRQTFATLIHDSAIRQNQAISGNSDSEFVFNLSNSLMVNAPAPLPISSSVENRHRDMPMKSLGGSIGPNTSISQLASVFDPELQQLSEFESIPRLTSLSEHVGFVPPDGVKVQAECHETGMNITFHLSVPDERYTGAVYAAERFEQCRVFVRASNTFAIFIPRPQHNTWCNALEIDKVVSAVIVMSNDRVLPHDVTTKDDLFFHVTCNYTSSKVNEIRRGIVVGGPSPVSIASSEMHRSISLQIMKKGRPVDSVFIGETLIARVQSEIPAERLRVVDCTAHRVGGTGPPASVGLIADGCALLPSLMAPMKMGDEGWESPLSAFRIDGSEQIDVVCMVVVCSDEACPNVSCPASKERPTRSLADKPPIRVDRRLIVRARSIESGERVEKVFAELCLQPSVYLSGLGLLATCLLALAISVCVSAKHRSDSVEELLSISQVSTPQRDMGAKYIRTLSL
ncbi:hypothetical protein Q1695_005656 [Nippostrongylus brasiliensis]|nr:hypothetical protein Q1695_005656 [Nippostrongylus brasiliensis]